VPVADENRKPWQVSQQVDLSGLPATCQRAERFRLRIPIGLVGARIQLEREAHIWLRIALQSGKNAPMSPTHGDSATSVERLALIRFKLRR